ncbi:5' nucleotidase, NT5C type [Clostridium botulinum]|uniref:5' nucleotidase, NT5C type n=1 Tax=Clostridium botulinum TaxID=1491 RepID=UPI0007DF8635|nr:NIF family HAD-type phosphatase [Clostridium botulinum]KEJ02326.1 nucleotidase [Clostridium botulinum F 357]
MDNLNICIDIDGTITEPYYWLEISNKYFKKNIKPEDITVYNIEDVLGITEEEYMKFYEKYKVRIHTEEKLRQGAKKVLNELNKYHNIYFITAREKSLEVLTKSYLINHSIKFRDLYVLGSHYKVDKAKELNCDIFIEDNPSNVVELSEAGFKVILLDTNYNKHIKENENIIRISHWDEVYNIVKEISSTEEKAI